MASSFANCDFANCQHRQSNIYFHTAIAKYNKTTLPNKVISLRKTCLIGKFYTKYNYKTQNITIIQIIDSKIIVKQNSTKSILKMQLLQPKSQKWLIKLQLFAFCTKPPYLCSVDKEKENKTRQPRRRQY